MMYSGEILYIEKTKHTRCLALVEKYCYSSTGILLLRQLKYSAVAFFLQGEIAKGGVFMYILRASFTTKDGTKIYAKDYGKRAFRIWIGPGPEPAKRK